MLANQQNAKSTSKFQHNNQHAEKEIKKENSIDNSFKKMKCLEINLTKEVKEFYNENFKIMRRETEEDARSWRDIP